MEQSFSGNGNITDEQWAIFNERLPFVLEQMASSHTQNPKSPVKLLPYDTNIYPFQTPETYHVSGNPLDLVMADTISPIAIKGYLKERDRLESDKEVSDIIAECSDVIKNGQNVVVVTSHADLIDIVTATLVVRDLILKKGDNIAPKSTAMILSKMASRLQYSVKGFEIPAVTVISQFCNDIYFSFPRTETARDALSDLPDDCVNNNNELMRRALEANLDTGGVLLGMAATGTTRIRQDDKTGKQTLAPITAGTKALMTHQGNYVLFIDNNMSDGFGVNKLSRPTRFDEGYDIDITMANFYFGKSIDSDINKNIGNIAISD